MKNSALPLLVFFLILIGVFLNMPSDQEKLNEIINSYQDYESYDYKKYPLGLYTKEHYKSEANFALDLIDQLDEISIDKLDEDELISYELLQFVLNDIVDYYEFERYLNPLLSDSGFHSSLNYMVRPLSNYKKTIEYLNKLNSLPRFSPICLCMEV